MSTYYLIRLVTLFIFLTLTQVSQAETFDQELSRLRAENDRLKREATGEKPVERAWTLVGMWSGSTNRNVESFTITAEEWTISWSHRGQGNFIVWVNGSTTKSRKRLAANEIGRTVSETIMRGSGTFWLEITGDTDWEIVVTSNEPRPGGARLTFDDVDRLYGAAQIERWENEARSTKFNSGRLPTWWALHDYAKKVSRLPGEDNHKRWVDRFISVCEIKESARRSDLMQELNTLRRDWEFMAGR